jgi:hypothetical protein
MGRSIDAFSDGERIAYYRQMVLEALRSGGEAITDSDRVGHLEVAQRWASIADEVEQVTQRQAERASRSMKPPKNGDGEWS